MGHNLQEMLENKSTPYIHIHRPEIEKFMNQIEWMFETLQEAKEKKISSSSGQTPTQ